MNEEEHHLRGHRVPALVFREISEFSRLFCKIFQLKKSSFSKRNISRLIAEFEESDIYIDAYENDWKLPAEALVDSGRLIICMPEFLLRKLMLADAKAIRIFLHELGHIFLGHQPNLYYSDNSRPTVNECSEWQADTFADEVIYFLGLDEPSPQLEIKF